MLGDTISPNISAVRDGSVLVNVAETKADCSCQSKDRSISSEKETDAFVPWNNKNTRQYNVMKRDRNGIVQCSKPCS